jgi:hypothetical protein
MPVTPAYAGSLSNSASGAQPAVATTTQPVPPSPQAV